jgi:nitrate reductase NapE component
MATGVAMIIYFAMAAVTFVIVLVMGARLTAGDTQDSTEWLGWTAFAFMVACLWPIAYAVVLLGGAGWTVWKFAGEWY